MNSIMTTPYFWAAHHHLILRDDDHETAELTEQVFGLSSDDVSDYYSSQLVQLDEVSSPLGLSVGHGYSLGVEVADCGEDGHEQRYYLGHDSWDEWQLLGYDSGHFALPAFRWSEVRAIGAAAGHHHGKEVAATAVLLLLPSVYFNEADDLADAKKHVSACWSELAFAGVLRPDVAAEATVTSLSGHEIRWWHDRRLGWINDGRYSFRNPNCRLAPGQSEERFSRIDSLLRFVGIGA
jgi:hypothetical protein